MAQHFKTDQEAFWAGQFGSDYIARNSSADLIGRNLALFTRVLARCGRLDSLIEFGANVGMNLRALRSLLPLARLDAIEINENAVRELRAWGGAGDVFHGSVLDFRPDRTWDAVLIKGVLIHINPDFLPQLYASLYQASRRYVFVVEYYNPTPVEVLYRGHAARLFKRDFAGEMLDKYADLRIVDYGFVWHRDPQFPQDDVTWFVLEKAGA